jgi:hypothetical protein
MKLDHPSMFAFEHSAGGFGMPDTPTSDEGTYVGPISLHNAIQHVAMRMDCMATWSDESVLQRSPSEDRGRHPAWLAQS